jgi:hypothetical protein
MTVEELSLKIKEISSISDDKEFKNALKMLVFSFYKESTISLVEVSNLVQSLDTSLLARLKAIKGALNVIKN